MSSRLFATGLTVQFENCSDYNTARKRLRHLQLSLNEIYPGVVQLTADADNGFGEDNVSFPAAIGVRVDRYSYTKHGGNGLSRPTDSPEPWELALDVINGVNMLVDGVKMIYRSDHLGITKLSDIDITETESFGPDYVNEHVTIYGETLASQFEEPPNWVKGRAGVNYYIGSVDYDTRDFGGTDPSKSVEAVATDLVEQALVDLLPKDAVKPGSDDGLMILLRLPDSLTRVMESQIGWQRSIDKASKSNLGPPGVWVQVTWTNGLGFLPIEKVDYSYGNIDVDE